MKKLCIIALLFFQKSSMSQEFPLKQREIGTISLLLDGKSREALQFFVEKIFLFDPEYLNKGIRRVIVSSDESGNLSLDLMVYTATDSCGFMLSKYFLGADKYIVVTKYNLVTKDIISITIYTIDGCLFLLLERK
jgi:hypothetical protein